MDNLDFMNLFLGKQADLYQDNHQSTSSEMSYSRGSKYGHGRGRSYGGSAGRGFNRGSPNPKPVEVGKEYDVDIIEISRQGDGVARVQGFVVFVQNGKVGNNIKVRVTQVGDRSAKATTVVQAIMNQWVDHVKYPQKGIPWFSCYEA